MAVPFTSTTKVHEVPGPRVAFDRLMLFDPGAAAIVPPPQEPVRPLSGVETAKLSGRISVNAIPVSAIGFTTGFVRTCRRLVSQRAG